MSVILVTFQGFSGHMWLMVTVLDTKKYRTLPSSHKVRLDSAGLEPDLLALV